MISELQACLCFWKTLCKSVEMYIHICIRIHAKIAVSPDAVLALSGVYSWAGGRDVHVSVHTEATRCCPFFIEVRDQSPTPGISG